MTYENTILLHSYIFPSEKLAILSLPDDVVKRQKKRPVSPPARLTRLPPFTWSCALFPS